MADEPLLLLLVLTGAALLVVVCAAGCLLRKPFTLSQWVLHYLDLLLVRVLWRARISGRLSLSPGQGAVIVCNHRSSIDPCIVHLVAGHRAVHWMVAQLYGERTFIGRLLKTLEIIPVQRRGSDISPIKAAIRLAAAGELVGMFPEGTINTTDEFMLPVRSGAILVALKARVPILPCYIEGSPYHEVAWRPVFMRARVKLKVGELTDLSDYYGREREEGVLEKLTFDCVREIARLADCDDFQPRPAGRDWKTWQ